MASRSLMALVAVTMLLTCLLSGDSSEPLILSSRLVHRFSDEAKLLLRVSEKVPERSSFEYYRMLFLSDLQRRSLKTSRSHSQLLFPSRGSQTMSFGNDFGWLHYTWIDIGTPNVSFLVALDVGSDLLWVPCNCVQCAPLSSSYDSMDSDLNEYSPSKSNSSKHLSCSHRLCDDSSNCKSPKQSCHYNVKYYSGDTSSSGSLIEDIMHLAAWGNDTESSTVQTPIIFGCGMKQSGGFLDGIAPDGLLGLGLKDISIPSFLYKAGLIRNSFSLCFNKDYSGRLFFGDQGPVNQHSTSFLPFPSTGSYETYIVGVQAFCIGNSCVKKTSFKALVDSGTSFTFIPEDIYKRVTEDFDKRVNATRSSFAETPWQYCYKTSLQTLPNLPSVTLVFPANNSFMVYEPFFPIKREEVLVGFCLAMQPTEEEYGIIGQNFMTGYRLVFNRESLELGWSKSHCQDLTDSEGMNLESSPNGSPENPLPTNEQQSVPPGSHAVAPAVAGRAPAKRSSSAPQLLAPKPFSLLWRSSLLIVLLHCFLFVFVVNTGMYA